MNQVFLSLHKLSDYSLKREQEMRTENFKYKIIHDVISYARVITKWIFE